MPAVISATLADGVSVGGGVAVPLLVPDHPLHGLVRHWAAEAVLALSGHAEVEEFSVLTRLPDPFRLDSASAARALAEGFAESVHPAAPGRPVSRISACGVAQGAVYDARVACAALDSDVPLATCDARALATYARIGARVVVVR